MRIVIFVLLFPLYISFRFVQFSNKIRLFSAKTCYMEDEDNMKKKIKEEMISGFLSLPINDNKPTYTLIWYDCKECKNILDITNELNMNMIYINGGSYFYDLIDEYSSSNTPLFYKDDQFIGDNLIDIYNEIGLQ